MSGPRLVAAGVRLRNQVNWAFPRRDKRSDGWIGDRAHSARKSDHNPDRNGWVHAIDLDHDFLGRNGGNAGREMAEEFANELIAYARRQGKGSHRLKYVIYNNRIASGTYAGQYWQWRAGSWGHTAHIHVSFTDLNPVLGRRRFPLPILSARHN